MFKKENMKIKNIVFYIFTAVIMLIFVYVVIRPYIYRDFTAVNKFLNKVHQAQNIAPSRLFINVWRSAKLEYVDETMNGQDWFKWRARYIKHIKTSDDAYVAINSMLASLNDPYTKFLQSKSFSRQKAILDSKITGVGVMFNKSGDEIVVNHILKNSSAQAQHIMPGDSIVSIDGMSVKNMSAEDIHTYIEMHKDKKVKFEIKRGDKIVVKELEKKEIPIDTMMYRITKDNIGIIVLANIMGEKALNDFRDILLKTNKTKGLIIDLRNNYGGILANAIQMADMMLGESKIVSIESRGNSKFQIYSDDISVFKEKPIVILVNGKTASAAEILAGTLYCNKGAVILGENTYGKNSIQQIIPMANNSGLVITSDKYILPNGDDIHNKGITPDYIYMVQTDKSGDDILIKDAEKLINGVVKNK